MTTQTNNYMRARGLASAYAKGFLVKKYYKEYQELYDAYLVNRGIPIRRSNTIVDERLIANE
jgi:hypothetical protein